MRHAPSPLLALSLASLPLLAACRAAAPHAPGSAPAGAAGASASDVDPDRFDPAELARHVATLSSDAFGGRAPATPGEERTLAYLQTEFARAGLEPVAGSSFLQEVPLVAITTDPAPLTVRGAAGELALEPGADQVAWTKRVVASSEIAASPLVFVGYGVVAPEYGWDDYAGLDARGKTVVMLVNDPGYASEDPALFRGRRMTYYGRWTYKFAEAMRQGAAGAIVVHETGPAGYPWEVVTGSWTGPQFDAPSADGNADRCAVEGWITEDAARRLFALAGEDWAAAKTAAGRRGFAPRALGDLRATIRLQNRAEHSRSYNVAGVLRGSERPDEAIVYMAHWDHLGTDPDLPGDGIYNGAVDNATGTASLILLAEAFARLDPPPRRSLLFLAVTAEESGLLGSAHYAAHPLLPLESTVAAINIDGLNVFGPTRDIAVVGRGQSDLDRLLEEAAAAQGRRVEDEATPEKGYFFRSDHFNFAKHGVPVLYTDPGVDDRAHGPERGKRLQDEYTAQRYHKPADEFDPAWDLGGALEDMALWFAVGRRLADATTWPAWSSTSEFRALRPSAGS